MHVCEPDCPCSRDRESLNDWKTPSSCCGHEKSFSALSDWTNTHENDCAIGATTVCARHLDAYHPLRASETSDEI